jgi:hypothetical protein
MQISVKFMGTFKRVLMQKSTGYRNGESIGGAQACIASNVKLLTSNSFHYKKLMQQIKYNY